MKRVLIFSLAYVPYVGGAELAMKEITDRISPNEYTFDMITLRFDRNLPRVEKVGNITVYRIGFTADHPKISDRAMPWQCKVAKILFPVTSFFKALSLNQANRYDVVWAMLANQAGFGALFFKLVHRNIPYVLELQDGNSLQQIKDRQPLLRAIWGLYRAIYRRADRIKVISNFIERLTRDIGYHGPIDVIPNAVDVAQFSAPIDDQKLLDLKKRFDKRMGDVFLFTASRLVLSRGVEDIIAALPHLPAHVKLLIAGDGEDRGKLEIHANKIASGRVIFAGSIDHTDIPALLRISDIFVRPSIIEGMGSAFVEAFAAGIPVVATPVGGIPDFLFDPDRNPEHEPTGLFCNVRDPQSVAAAVRRYLDDPALVARIVKNARALVVEKYDWNLIARAQSRLFDTARRADN